mmetsp:Transcript_17617/g.49898  ORF Transcript_17617/g.49898 Transcript_17617/m.49898 type:complete len:261 (+) Transcript_17617:174-956(+)
MLRFLGGCASRQRHERVARVGAVAEPCPCAGEGLEVVRDPTIRRWLRAVVNHHLLAPLAKAAEVRVAAIRFLRVVTRPQGWYPGGAEDGTMPATATAALEPRRALCGEQEGLDGQVRVPVSDGEGCDQLPLDGQTAQEHEEANETQGKPLVRNHNHAPEAGGTVRIPHEAQCKAEHDQWPKPMHTVGKVVRLLENHVEEHHRGEVHQVHEQVHEEHPVEEHRRPELLFTVGEVCHHHVHFEQNHEEGEAICDRFEKWAYG